MSIAESQPGLLNRLNSRFNTCLDRIFSGNEGLTFELHSEILHLGELYDKVKGGEITDPGEIEKINQRVNTWIEDARDHFGV